MFINKIMKITIALRMGVWGLGILLLLISRWIFENDHNIFCMFTMTYNGIILITSLIPIAQPIILLDLILSRKKVLMHILWMILLVVGLIVYVCAFVLCTGGV